MKRCWLVVLCAWLAIVAPSRVYAAPTDAAIAAAQRHFEQGTKAYTLADYERAAREYQAAYDAMPDPALLYNIAQAYRLGRNPAQALFFYRTYLERQPNASNRRDIEERMRELATELGPKPPSQPTPGPPAVVVLDATLSAPPPRAHKPVYKKGWFWGTMAGIAIAVGVGVGLGVGLTRSDAPGSTLGNQKVFSLGLVR